MLTPGELIAMQFISVAIFAPLQELGNIILAYREADASLANFEALMAQADRAAARVAGRGRAGDAACASTA